MSDERITLLDQAFQLAVMNALKKAQADPWSTDAPWIMALKEWALEHGVNDPPGAMLWANLHIATILYAVNHFAEAEGALTRKGYRRSCDIPACNCGDTWAHGGHADERLREISDALGEHRQGRTLLDAVTAIVVTEATLTAERTQLNAEMVHSEAMRVQLREAEATIARVRELAKEYEGSHCLEDDFLPRLREALTTPVVSSDRLTKEERSTVEWCKHVNAPEFSDKAKLLAIIDRLAPSVGHHSQEDK